jgi:hypothetical protein
MAGVPNNPGFGSNPAPTAINGKATETKSEPLIAILGLSEHQPSAMFDDITGVDGGNRLGELSFVRQTVGALARVERRIVTSNGLQIVAGVSGNATLTTVDSPVTKVLRVPPGIAIVDDEGGAATADIEMRWTAARLYAAIVLLPRSSMLPRSDVRLFRAAEAAFGGRVLGVVREPLAVGNRNSGIAEELSQKLGRPVVSVPLGKPSAGWGKDPAWAPLEGALERLGGLVADDGDDETLRGAHLVNSAEAARLVHRAKEDLMTARSLENAEPDRRQAAVDLARNVWSMVLEAANHGQEVAQLACIELLKEPPLLKLINIDVVDVTSLISDPTSRLRAIAELNVPKAELLGMRVRAVGKPSLPQIEMYLFERAERSADQALAEELAANGSPEVAGRATTFLGRKHVEELEEIAAAPPSDAAEALRSFVDANTHFEEWATRASGSSVAKVRDAVRGVRNRADAAKRTILMQAAADTLSAFQQLYTQPVVDLTSWERDRLRALSAANLWVSLAPRNADWVTELRTMLMSGIEFSRGPGERWAHKSAQAVASAQRRASRVVEAWYALALLGALTAGVSLLLLGRNLPVAAVFGFAGTCVVGTAVVKHRQYRDSASWEIYYVAPNLPKPSRPVDARDKGGPAKAK